jgi:hypothetical protein
MVTAGTVEADEDGTSLGGWDCGTRYATSPSLLKATGPLGSCFEEAVEAWGKPRLRRRREAERR